MEKNVLLKRKINDKHWLEKDIHTEKWRSCRTKYKGDSRTFIKILFKYFVKENQSFIDPVLN